MPYEFTAEEFNRFSEEILKAEGDQATLTSLLADMNGTITGAIAKDISQTEQVKTVTAENERLRKANMDLFLRVGQVMESPGPSGQQQTEEPKKLTTAEYMNQYFDKLDEQKGGK